MPYKDKEKQREYQREWMRKRRAAWIEENGPCIDCGSWEKLEIDHLDPSTKDPKLRKGSHGVSVWCWSDQRRLEELAKCAVRCHDCHLEKSRLEGPRGEINWSAKLNEIQVMEIRASNLTYPQLSAIYGVSKGQIGKIKRRERWKHV